MSRRVSGTPEASHAVEVRPLKTPSWQWQHRRVDLGGGAGGENRVEILKILVVPIPRGQPASRSKESAAWRAESRFSRRKSTLAST